MQQQNTLGFMMSIKKYGLMTLAACALIASQARAELAPPGVEDRLTRLENILQNQGMSDVLLQLQRLQDELQKIRGKLEVQEHTIEALKRHQQPASSDTPYSSTTLPTSAPVTATFNTQNTAPVDEEPDNGPLLPPPVTTSTTPAVTAKAKPAPIPVTDDNVDTQQSPEDAASELEDYQKAFGQLKSGNYNAAMSGFRAVLAKYPNGQYANNAQYWLGETYYVTRDFDSAAAAFNKVLEKYPGSNKTAGAMLKLGFIYHERGQSAKAIDILGQLTQKFPNSTESKLAQQRLALLHKGAAH